MVEKQNRYDCVCDFLNVFFDFVSVHANHTQSTRGTGAIFSRGCLELSFQRLIVFKQHCTVQVVIVKVNAINDACRTTG